MKALLNKLKQESTWRGIIVIAAVTFGLSSCVPVGFGVSYTNETDGVHRTITVERFSK